MKLNVAAYILFKMAAYNFFKEEPVFAMAGQQLWGQP